MFLSIISLLGLVDLIIKNFLTLSKYKNQNIFGKFQERNSRNMFITTTNLY